MGGRVVDRPTTSIEETRDGKNTGIATPRTPIPFSNGYLCTSAPTSPIAKARKLLGLKSHTDDIGRFNEMYMN